jgi:ribulose 1,5-bisphosphate carboxylase large subunit-like protein
LEPPETVCEDRVGEEDETITIDIMKPTLGATVTKNFEVWYNITGERPLKYVRIYLNDIVVMEQEYTKGETRITDIKKIISYAGIDS